MNSKHLLLYLAIFQLLIIGGMLGKAMLPLLFGEEITVAVEGRDPRDLFRGNYVELNYTFNQINLDSVANDLPAGSERFFGDIVYLEMVEEDSLHRVAAVWESPQDVDGILMKAVVNYLYGSGRDLYVTCGVESYFTDPDQALAIERYLRDRGEWGAEPPKVRIMIGPGGEARIKEIVLPKEVMEAGNE